MYDKYVTTKAKEDEWALNCYGDIPNLIPRTTVESVFVLGARNKPIVQRDVLYVLTAMILLFLGIIAPIIIIWRKHE